MPHTPRDTFVDPTPETVAAILVEFTGDNQAELALRHRVSTIVVQRVINRARHSMLGLALRASEGTGADVLWARPVTRLVLQSLSEAVLQAVRTAEALDALDRLVIALAILPEGRPTEIPADSPPHPGTPGESQPGTPSHADTPSLPRSPH